MVYAGTETIYVDNQNPAIIRLETATLDADSEYGASIELTKYFRAGQQLPRRFTTVINIAAGGTGTTATIAIEFQGSVDGTNWTDINACTAQTTNYPHDCTKNDQLWRYVRHYCTTIGTNNEMTATTIMGV